MNFNEFVNEVKGNIKLFLPKDYENAEVSTMECQKLNRAYTGLMVRKEGELLTPTINLNQLYNLNGYYDSLKQLLDHMIKMGLSSENRQQGIYFADDMEDIKALLATVTK